MAMKFFPATILVLKVDMFEVLSNWHKIDGMVRQMNVLKQSMLSVPQQ